MKIKIYNLLKNDSISKYHRWRFKLHAFDANACGYSYSYWLGIVLISFWFKSE